MKRSDLEHILRASKGITGETEFIVIGSQSILGPHPDAPRVLRHSMELDLYPKHRPDLSAALDGAMGELSQFHQTFGYRADGVSPQTATLSTGWESRLVKVSNDNTGGAIGWCLEPHDLAFVREMLRHHLAKPARLRELIAGAEETLRAKLTDALEVCLQRA